jgi:hypothetical protein
VGRGRLAVGRSGAKKGPGSDFVLDVFFSKMVFLKSPRRETPKNATKKSTKKIGFGFLPIFL